VERLYEREQQKTPDGDSRQMTARH
jgi:hypothetical protein